MNGGAEMQNSAQPREDKREAPRHGRLHDQLSVRNIVDEIPAMDQRLDQMISTFPLSPQM